MLLTQYPIEILKTWRTGRLGCLYLNSFRASRDDPEECSQLERIAQVLSTRPLLERKGIYRTIRHDLMAAQQREDAEQTHLLIEMLNHYVESVLQPNPTY